MSKNKLPTNLDHQKADSSKSNHPTSLTGIIHQSTFMGPLPPPETLERYNKIVPGLAEKIVHRFEKQSEHRMDLENRVIRSNIIETYIGQGCAFTIVMSIVFIGYQLIQSGHDVKGFVSILGALASLMGVFVYGKRSQQKELQEKQNKLKAN